ncbi:ATP-binding protein [Arthrobacter sp. HS15c]|uniref:ATP-binding protein n=1 Tax=Arthrobacter sp. HS15c TaxID=3230279 RepID=UPI0034659308
MSVPTPDELTNAIVRRSNLSAETVANVLVGHGVSLMPVPPAQRSLDILRLSIKGKRVNTLWDGPFEKTFEFSRGVTALITNENLRGKSTILELITWGLRGSPRRLRDDVKPWFDRISLEYSVNGMPMAVVLQRQEHGFVADVLRASDSETLRSYLAGDSPSGEVHVLASGLSEGEFAKQQDQMMLTLLALEPMTNFQKFRGSDQGRPQVNSWPAYFGGLYLPRAGSEVLLGDTVFAGLPARILQMFCNVPLMSTHIRLTTLSKQARQDEANQARQIAGDSLARAKERAALAVRLAEVQKQMKSLPSGSSRSYEVVAAELRDAEQALESASAESRAAGRTFHEVKAVRQAEERQMNDIRETELAAALFHGLLPKHCPRCEQSIESQRTELELSVHQCAVCTKELPALSGIDADADGAPEDAGDVLEALRQAETAAKETAAAAATDEREAQKQVETLAVELSNTSRSDEFTKRLALQLEEARLQGSLESVTEGSVELETSESLVVLEAAVEELARVTRASAATVFAELNKEIVTLGKKFGIDNLENVELDRRGGMQVTTAGVQASFKNVTGGERLRLRVAVVVALLRVGHRAGVGSHPGLILLDSPGSDELTVEDEATLLRELDSLKDELPTLQVVVASAEPAAVLGNVAQESTYSSLDGSPLW